MKSQPRRIAVLLSVFCLLMAGGVGQVQAATFNVTTYGAVGDDATDNTAAFSACINAIIAAGGGRMYLPDGVYRGNILIPGIASWITLEIVGESEPTPVWGTIGAFPFQKNGTIVKSLAISDINDPKNLGIGDINYWVVEGNVGAVDKFVKNGGASIRTRRIGSASGGN